MALKLRKKVLQKIKSFPKVDVEKIIERIKPFEYVSFDIFDTLIKRNVPSPSDAFKVIELWYYNKVGKNIKNFKEKRIKAEREARIKTLGEEITLEDIYACFPGLSFEEKNLVMNIEIAVEQDLCRKNPCIYSVYDWCIKNGKKVVIISDMYLPQSVVESILHENNFESYGKLYLSSTVGKKKSTGSLFDHVLNDLGITNNQLIHIGDSIKSDYIRARKAKISVVPIPKYISTIARDHDKGIVAEDVFSHSCIRAFVNNRIPENQSLYYKFGYESFGLLLYGFCKWMLQDLKNKGIKKIFFFSRDGYVMKRAFDIVNTNKEIESCYLYVSRRSLRVPQIWITPELKDVVGFFPLAKMLTVEIFLHNLGLEVTDYVDKLQKHGLSPTDTIKRSEILRTASIINFYEDIKESVIANSKREYKLLLEYLKQNSFNGDVAVVDIGWHGTLQHFLTEIVKMSNLNVNMYGYYIGLATEAKYYLNLAGYVVDLDSSTNSCDSWKAFNGLAETLFLAQEGSTEKFEVAENGIEIKPVLYKYEYMEEGKLAPEAIKVKELQDGAVEFVRDFVSNKSMQLIDFSSSTAFRNIFFTGTYPSKKDLELFFDFRFFEEKIDYLAMPKTFSFYLINPKKLVMDLYFSRWKVGFLKKFFKIPLPYKQIYEILRKL